MLCINNHKKTGIEILNDLIRRVRDIGKAKVLQSNLSNISEIVYARSDMIDIH